MNRFSIYSSQAAYKVWARNYDQEENNLMLHSDKIILRELISGTDLKSKIILDYGCGTGRNRSELIKGNPREIIGCDISAEMLNKYGEKYPNARNYLIKKNRLTFFDHKQCDMVVSTLVIAHIKNIKSLFVEWNRILKDHADLIITDFHPVLLAGGGARTFRDGDSRITIKNYIHEISAVSTILAGYGFKTINLIEKMIDENVKHFYFEADAMNVYRRFEGLPFIYGIHMRR